MQNVAEEKGRLGILILTERDPKSWLISRASNHPESADVICDHVEHAFDLQACLRTETSQKKLMMRYSERNMTMEDEQQLYIDSMRTHQRNVKNMYPVIQINVWNEAVKDDSDLRQALLMRMKHFLVSPSATLAYHSNATALITEVRMGTISSKPIPEMRKGTVNYANCCAIMCVWNKQPPISSVLGTSSYTNGDSSITSKSLSPMESTKTNRSLAGGSKRKWVVSGLMGRCGHSIPKTYPTTHAKLSRKEKKGRLGIYFGIDRTGLQGLVHVHPIIRKVQIKSCDHVEYTFDLQAYLLRKEKSQKKLMMRYSERNMAMEDEQFHMNSMRTHQQRNVKNM
eukprot:scaffold3416_cov120-Cylindrotheca_fusiformis.AAC.4